MAAFRPTYITFDCYGTLIDFQMSQMTRTLFTDRIDPDRLQAFEYMIDQLSCDPAALLHVSSSLRYDHMSAYDMGIRHTVYIDRGHGPCTDYYGYPTIQNLGGLPALVGLE